MPHREMSRPGEYPGVTGARGRDPHSNRRRVAWIALLFGLAALMGLTARLDAANRGVWLSGAVAFGIAGLGFVAFSLSQRSGGNGLIKGLDVRFGIERDDDMRPDAFIPMVDFQRGSTSVHESTWTGDIDELPPEMQAHVRELLARAKPDPNHPGIRIAHETTRRTFTHLEEMPPDIRRKVEAIIKSGNRPG